MKRLRPIALSGILLACLPTLARAVELKVGDKAPDFTLKDTNWKDVKLSDYLGKKNVILAFYVLAFTGGWTQELKAYQADIANFEKKGVQVLGISVDSSPANKVFAQQNGLTFPLLSDFQRKVSEDYGVLNPDAGFANRTTFVVDKDGVIQFIQKGKEAIDPSGAGAACSTLEHKK